jgi:cytochrome c-type biogenesis protein CcmH
MPKRLLHLGVVLLAAFTMLGAGTPSTPFDKIGHKLMCPCGCAEILLECNHVGCPDSARMIGELHAQIDAQTQPLTGLAEAAVLNWFSLKYGPTVLAAPLRGNLFDAAVWALPFVLLVLGTAGVILLLRFWKRRHAALTLSLPAAQPPTPGDAALRDRIRSETRYGA